MRRIRFEKLYKEYKQTLPKDYAFFPHGIRAQHHDDRRKAPKPKDRPLVSDIPIKVSQRLTIDGERWLQLEWPDAECETLCGLAEESKVTGKNVDLSPLGIPYVYSPSRIGAYLYAQLCEFDIPHVTATRKPGFHRGKLLMPGSEGFEAEGFESWASSGSLEEWVKQVKEHKSPGIDTAICVSLLAPYQRSLGIPSFVAHFHGPSTPINTYVAQSVWAGTGALRCIRTGLVDHAKDFCPGLPACFTAMTAQTAHDLAHRSKNTTTISCAEKPLAFDRCINIPDNSQLFDVSSWGVLGQALAGRMPTTHEVKGLFELALPSAKRDTEVVKGDVRWIGVIAASRAIAQIVSDVCDLDLEPFPLDMLSMIAGSEHSDREMVELALAELKNVVRFGSNWGDKKGNEYRFTTQSFHYAMSQLPFHHRKVKLALRSMGWLKTTNAKRDRFTCELACGNRYVVYLDSPYGV